jgi:hypothetical protein
MEQVNKAQFWQDQISSFTYWRGKQQVKKTVANKWLPIKVTAPSSSVSVILLGNIRLEVAASSLAEVLPVVYRSLQRSR